MLTSLPRRPHDGSFVTLGINTHGTRAGYGYIVGADGSLRLGTVKGDHAVRRVERFVEKPAREQALELLGDPRGAWWNAGIFVWRVEALREGLAQYAPGVIGGTSGVAWRVVSRSPPFTSRCRPCPSIAH